TSMAALPEVRAEDPKIGSSDVPASNVPARATRNALCLTASVACPHNMSGPCSLITFSYQQQSNKTQYHSTFRHDRSYTSITTLRAKSCTNSDYMGTDPADLGTSTTTSHI
ncbi:hypothetical protein BGZ82_003715, partial [Podila clonocystis]